MARRDRRRKEAGAFAVSVLVHLLLLVVLARVALPPMYEPPAPPSSDVQFQVQLIRQPPAPSAAPAPRVTRRSVQRALPTPAVSRAPAAQRAPAPPARAIQAAPRPAAPKAPQAPPAPPSHASASIPAVGASNGAPNAAGASAGANRWKVTGGDDGQDGVRKFLRATVGCSHEDYAKLTPAERAYCDQRVGHDARMMAGATVDTIGPAKRGYYSAVQDAYQSLHDPRPRYDANGNRVLAGHPPGVGCKLGGGDLPPHSLKIGPCFITPPQGLGTEEADLPPPPR